ncbi:MAG: family 78 glycoside hydrolase catalytic domain [Tepidisphaeraceae bacterium]
MENLRCEFLRDPVAIGVARPRLSWTIASDMRGESQSAYQIQVSREGRTVWDSGRVESDRSDDVEYAGEPLASGAAYQWKVRVWDQQGTPSDWSDSSTWGMGFLKPEDWKAKWIIPPAKDKALDEPYLRRLFTLDDVPQSAIARVNVMGWFELYANGVKVGQDVISPAVTDYSKRSLYLTYDLKPYLLKGPNCIGLWMSRGWYWLGRRGVDYDQPIARVQLDMTVDGKPRMIGTDANWRCKTSGRSILGKWSWDNFGGEQVDARLDEPAWSSPQFPASDWAAVSEVPPPPVPAEVQRTAADRVIKTVPAVSCTDLGGGFYALDFGVNLTGWLSLRLPRLRAGQVVTIHYSDTSVSRKDFQTHNQQDRFISAGTDGEIFADKFNYHGFRYATIEGLPSAPQARDAQALAIGADWEPGGSFQCSNPLINRMHDVDLWTLRSLSQGGYLSDCPHRERLGYGGDGQVSIESCVSNFWMPAFYEKWTTDWRDVQDPLTGYIPHMAPQGEGGGGPPWGAGLQALTWRLNLYYDDRRALQENYQACRRYVEWIESHAQDGIVRAYGGQWDFIGDWVPPGPVNGDQWNFPSRTAAECFNNCYLVYLVDQLAQMADAIGLPDQAKVYRDQAEAMRPRIQAAFYDSGKQFYAVDQQAYQLMPLLTRVTPQNLRGEVTKNLQDEILVKNKGHLDTGMLGTYFLIQYLQETGRDDLLWTVVAQTTYPGWGYMLDRGATTWWEQWNGGPSRIHACFNSLDGWFYQGLAGIRPDPTAPGFKKIIIKPAIVGDLTWVKADYDSLHGRIVSQWEYKDARLSMHVVIPANTTATIYVPTRDAATVLEGGAPATRSVGLVFLRMENGAAVFHAGSGVYDFTSSLDHSSTAR